MNDRDPSGYQRSLPQRASAQLPPAPSIELAVSSVQLFRGARELIIEHDGARYRLRITRQDKLILTK